MRNLVRLAVLAVAALVVTQVLVQGRRSTAALGDDAPALRLPDLGGRTVDLGALRGRVVALNFWATWCPPCQVEIPELAQVWRENQGRCFEMLGVAEESGAPADVAMEARRLGIPYPVLLDSRGSAAEAYRVPGYPRTYLIDAEGKVRRVFDGALRRQALEEALRPLLSAAPASCPRA